MVHRLTHITLILAVTVVLVGGATAPAATGGWLREPAYGETRAALATVEFEGKVYAFARGLDDHVWLQTYAQATTTGSWSWSSSWTPVPGGGVTEAALAATTAGDTLYLFARGMDRQAWVNTKRRGGGPTDGWSGWSRGGIPEGGTNVPLSAAGTRDGTVLLFRRADDGYVYSSKRSAGVWSSWQKASPIATATAPAAAYDGASDRLYLFVSRTDGQVFLTMAGADPKSSKTCAVNAVGSGFGAPAAPIYASGPVAAAAREGSLTLFIRSDDGRISGLTHNGGCSPWSAPVEVGGDHRTDAAPAVAPFVFKPLAGGRFLLLAKGFEERGIYYNDLKALRIQAVRVSDTSGNACPLPPPGSPCTARVTREQVTSWVDYANRVYADTGIRFVYNAAADFVDRADSNLNQTNLCDPKAGVTTNCLTKEAGNAEAAKFPGRVTVLFRFGRDLDPSGNRVANGGGWSWNDLNFVVMPGADDTPVCGHPNLSLLAHELGHYIGLPHTFTIPFVSMEHAEGFVPTPAVGDFDGDGKDDVITFRRGPRGVEGDVNIALSSGSQFGTARLWHGDFNGGIDLPLVGDFDGNGKDDIVTFNRGTFPGAWVALSNGKGFGERTLWHGDLGFGDELPAVGDFDGNGKDDIAVFTRGTTGDVFVALSNGKSWFGLRSQWHGDFAFGDEVPVVGDFDGNGKDDIAAFTRGSTGDVFVSLSKGNRFEGTGVSWHGDFAFADSLPAVGDFDGNGRDDIVAFTRGSAGDVLVALSSGKKSFRTSRLWHDDFAFGAELPAVGDFNGGGWDDIVAFTRDGTDDVYVAKSNSSKFTGTGDRWHEDFGFVRAAFDGDGLNDTPLDPYVDVPEVQCDGATTTLVLGGIPFVLPRNNIMSYYDHSDHTVTSQQIARVHETLANRDLP